jgi:hypothetical protein
LARVQLWSSQPVAPAMYSSKLVLVACCRGANEDVKQTVEVCLGSLPCS